METPRPCRRGGEKGGPLNWKKFVKSAPASTREGKGGTFHQKGKREGGTPFSRRKSYPQEKEGKKDIEETPLLPNEGGKRESSLLDQ